MKAFGERLKELRQAKGLTQRQLADVLSVSGHAVHCWESDKQDPTMTTLVKLSEYFEVSLDYLFGKSDY